MWGRLCYSWLNQLWAVRCWLLLRCTIVIISLFVVCVVRFDGFLHSRIQQDARRHSSPGRDNYCQDACRSVDTIIIIRRSLFSLWSFQRVSKNNYFARISQPLCMSWIVFEPPPARLSDTWSKFTFDRLVPCRWPPSKHFGSGRPLVQPQQPHRSTPRLTYITQSWVINCQLYCAGFDCNHRCRYFYLYLWLWL